MLSEGTKRLISYPLITAGAVLLLLGARDVVEPIVGQKAAARTYDEASAAVIPAGTKPAPVQRGDTVGKLTIPRLGATYYVMEGDHEEELRRGPGHLRGSAMPGAQGNCIIAGHRDTHFRILKDIQKGDDILVETTNGQYLYRVKSMRVVPADDTAPLQPTSRAELNLITCYPFYYVGNAPKRFVVEALLAARVSATGEPVVE
jgi:sortase A